MGSWRGQDSGQGPHTVSTPNPDVLLHGDCVAEDYSWFTRFIEKMGEARRAEIAARIERDASDLRDVLGACLGGAL